MMHWCKRVLLVTGSLVGAEVFLQYQDTVPIHFSSMSITGNQTEVDWIFPGTKRTCAFLFPQFTFHIHFLLS